MKTEVHQRGAALEGQCRVDLDTEKHTESEFLLQTEFLEDCEEISGGTDLQSRLKLLKDSSNSLEQSLSLVGLASMTALDEKHSQEKTAGFTAI